jgi:phosphopantetheine adenylyltransferase
MVKELNDNGQDISTFVPSAVLNMINMEEV